MATKLEKLISAYRRAGHSHVTDDLLIVDARDEQAELVAALRELYDPAEHHPAGQRVEALLSRFPSKIVDDPSEPA